jgi:hypothetical protein
MSNDDLLPETQELEEEMWKARRVDKRQKWGLFALSMLLLIALAVIGVLWWQTRDYAALQEQAAASEQVEKKNLAEEAQEALCKAGDAQFYDADLCQRLQAVAAEPSRGEAGPRGPEGPMGPIGPQGIPGEQGPRGFEGLMGKIGIPGIPGLDGIDGADGRDGIDGAPGPQGETGAMGPAGPAGPQGERGEKGAPGEPGPQGERGPAGADGATGATGAQGVSITDVDCVGDGDDSYWQITLSDGAVLTSDGPCRVRTIPGL